jgi:hypothetical protein
LRFSFSIHSARFLDFAQGILGFGHFFRIGKGPVHAGDGHDGDAA